MMEHKIKKMLEGIDPLEQNRILENVKSLIEKERFEKIQSLKKDLFIIENSMK